MIGKIRKDQDLLGKNEDHKHRKKGHLKTRVCCTPGKNELAHLNVNLLFRVLK